MKMYLKDKFLYENVSKGQEYEQYLREYNFCLGELG
jgi:hypothetical protein